MRAVDDPPPALFSRLTLGFLLWVYRLKGWQVEGAPPATRRFVITGAPHTSNWDFVFFAGVTRALGIRPRFMGKLSLFRWPLRRFMFDMGGVPVDRSARGDYVAAMIAEFARRDEFALVVAPEGTRRSVKGWRSGFYHIALGAGVPIVPAWVDHETMKGGLGPPLMPSGDYATDLGLIAEFYLSKMPNHPKVLALAAQAQALKEGADD